MPCPHFVRDTGECAVLEEAPGDDEEAPEAPLDAPVNPEWCLSTGTAYRSCPLFRKFLAELLP